MGPIFIQSSVAECVWLNMLLQKLYCMRLCPPPPPPLSNESSYSFLNLSLLLHYSTTHTLVSAGKKKQAIAVYRRNQAWIQSSDNPLDASPIKKTNASNERVLHLILEELHNIIAILISFGLIFLRSLVDWEILVVHARRCVCVSVYCVVWKKFSLLLTFLLTLASRNKGKN